MNINNEKDQLEVFFTPEEAEQVIGKRLADVEFVMETTDGRILHNQDEIEIYIKEQELKTSNSDIEVLDLPILK